jgi:mRNA interferase MazF
MAYKRGEVILVPFPFTDLSATKVRPAVILSSAAYHAYEPDLLVGAITSQIGGANQPTDYMLKDWKGAGLKFPSAFKAVIFTLDPKRVIHKVGSLNKTELAQLDKRLKLAFGL